MLQLLIKWSDHTENYPRLVLLDFVDLPPTADPSTPTSPTPAKPAPQRRVTSARRDVTSLLESRHFSFRILCEHEAGWHSCAELQLTSRLSAATLSLYAPYLARMTAMLRNSDHLHLNCASGADGDTFVSWLEQVHQHSVLNIVTVV